MSEDEEGDFASYKHLCQFYNIVKHNEDYEFDYMRIDKTRVNKQLEIIIEQSSDMNYQFPNGDFTKLRHPQAAGCTALHFTVGQKNETSTRDLLKRGIDITVKNLKGSTALHTLIDRNDHAYKNRWQMKRRLNNKILDMLLSAHVELNVVDNPRDGKGISHFHVACMENHSSAVEFFLSNGVSVNQVVDGDFSVFLGYTPLHFAVRFCALQTTEMLIKYRADLNLKDAKGMTPIDLLLEQSMAIVDLINTVDNSNSAWNCQISKLMLEVEINKKIMGLLLVRMRSLKYSLNFDSTGLSLFHLACTLEDTSLIEQFLGQTDDINHYVKIDSSFWPGYTALHFAAHFDIKIVKFLLQRGANIEAKDANGLTPFDICTKRYKTEEVHFILQSRSVWKDIVLSDNETTLLDVVRAMQDSNTLEHCLKGSQSDKVLRVSSDSPLWPGHTPLHLAIMFTETSKIISDFETTSHCYSNEDFEELEREYLKRIEVCLRHGADVTVQDTHGRTALHLAYRMQKSKVVKLLLREHTQIINAIDTDHLSHLYIACAFDYPRMVDKLLANDHSGVNVQIKSTFKWQQNQRYFARGNCKAPRFFVTVESTPLHAAATAETPQVLSILLEYGAIVNARDSNGVTPLHRALVSKNPESMIKTLLSSPNLRQYTFNGLNHLHLALEFDDQVVIDRLIREGADVNSVINFNATAEHNFYENTEKEYPGIVVNCDRQPCLGHLAEPFNFMSKFDKCAALDVAVCRNRRETVKSLLKCGGDAFASRPNGWTAFYRAMHRWCCGDLILTEYNGDIAMQKRMQGESGITRLHIACRQSNLGSVEYLLKNGADVNAQLKFNSPIWPGYTPMHVLASQIGTSNSRQDELTAIMQLLLRNGADATLVNSEKNSPIHQTELGWDQISYEFYARLAFTQLLLESLKDFKLNPTNVDGISHFHVACLRSDVDIMEKFLESGANVNQPVALYSSKFPGCAPLHLVLNPDSLVDNDRRIDAIDLLLRYGADVHAGDLFGNSALHVATKLRPPRHKIFDKILSIGIGINVQNVFGEVPLGMILSSKKFEKDDIKFFLKHDANLNIYEPIRQEGYLKMFFPINQSISKKVMKSPGIMKIDDIGRNAIHNVVSWEYTRSKSYPAVIGVLMERGCNVDLKDKFGRTPLDLALEFTNDKAMVGLLTAGADINITNPDGNTTFSSLFSFPKGEEWHYQFKFDNQLIFQPLAMHIRKLQMVGLYVNKLNAEVLEERLKNWPLDEEQIDKVKNELKKIKDITIESTHLSPYDFFSETGAIAAFPYMPLSEQQAINTFFTSMKKNDFKQFGYLLKIRHQKTIKRLSLLKPASISLIRLLKVTFPKKCLRHILRFLTNTDLENLIAANKLKL